MTRGGSESDELGRTRNMKAVSIHCPVCDVRPGHPCKAPQGGNRDHVHAQRGVLVSGHPALQVECRMCRAEVGDLCIDMRTLKTSRRRNINFHSQRDDAAYAARVGDVVRGLRYPGGGVVRTTWLTADRRRKKDRLRSVRFRAPGGSHLEYWAATFDDKIWFASFSKHRAQQLALMRRRESAVDQLGDLSRPACTIWS